MLPFYTKLTSFIRDLSIQNWRVNSDDPNNNFKGFLWRLEGCIERQVPPCKPWITTEIKCKINLQDKIFYRKKSDPNEIICNKFRNSVNRDIKKCKEKILLAYFEKNNHNMKMIWNGIKETY